jgi:hypothetical protein
MGKKTNAFMGELTNLMTMCHEPLGRIQVERTNLNGFAQLIDKLRIDWDKREEEAKKEGKSGKLLTNDPQILQINTELNKIFSRERQSRSLLNQAQTTLERHLEQLRGTLGEFAQYIEKKSHKLFKKKESVPMAKKFIAETAGFMQECEQILRGLD